MSQNSNIYHGKKHPICFSSNLSEFKSAQSNNPVLNTCLDYLNEKNDFISQHIPENGLFVKSSYYLFSSKFFEAEKVIYGLQLPPNTKLYIAEGNHFEELIREEIEICHQQSIKIFPTVIVPKLKIQYIENDDEYEYEYDHKVKNSLSAFGLQDEYQVYLRKYNLYLEYDCIFLCKNSFSTEVAYTIIPSDKNEKFEKLQFEVGHVYAIEVKRSCTIEGIFKLIQRCNQAFDYLVDLLEDRGEIIDVMMLYNRNRTEMNNTILKYFTDFFDNPTEETYQTFTATILSDLKFQKDHLNINENGNIQSILEQINKTIERLENYDKKENTKSNLFNFALMIKNKKFTFSLIFVSQTLVEIHKDIKMKAKRSEEKRLIEENIKKIEELNRDNQNLQKKKEQLKQELKEKEEKYEKKEEQLKKELKEKEEKYEKKEEQLKKELKEKDEKYEKKEEQFKKELKEKEEQLKKEIKEKEEQFKKELKEKEEQFQKKLKEKEQLLLDQPKIISSQQSKSQISFLQQSAEIQDNKSQDINQSLSTTNIPQSNDIIQSQQQDKELPSCYFYLSNSYWKASLQIDNILKTATIMLDQIKSQSNHYSLALENNCAITTIAICPTKTRLIAYSQSSIFIWKLAKDIFTDELNYYCEHIICCDIYKDKFIILTKDNISIGTITSNNKPKINTIDIPNHEYTRITISNNQFHSFVCSNLRMMEIFIQDHSEEWDSTEVELSEDISALAFDKKYIFVGGCLGSLLLYNIQSKSSSLGEFGQRINKILCASLSCIVVLDHEIKWIELNDDIDLNNIIYKNKIYNKAIAGVSTSEENKIMVLFQNGETAELQLK